VITERRLAQGFALTLLAGAAVARAEDSLPAFALAPVPQAVAPGAFWWLIPLPALLAWMALAAWRAWRADPHFDRRRARRRLWRLASGWKTPGRMPTAAELEAWSAGTADLLAVPRLAPTSEEIFAALEAAAEVKDKEAWRRLWRESRAALYGPVAQVPADWPARARTAILGTVIERAASRWPVRRQHWLPLLLLGLVLPLVTLRAAEPAIPTERAAALARLAVEPRDWTAHHRLARSFAREENWSAALAHEVAAFALAPREAAVRTGLREALARADRVDPALRALAEGSRWERLPSVLSAGEWQQVGWIALVLAAGGLAMGIVGLYAGPRWRRAGWIAALAGGTALGLSAQALKRYDLLGTPAVACLARQTDLRSVPSDLVEIQQAAPLTAGTLVRVDGTYLGWTRIVGRGNIVGWVRSDAVLPLYAALPRGGVSGFGAVRR
jgi:hypothetical protein